MMYKIILLVVCCFLSGFSSAQNLLPNGGFEDENICTEFHINCAPEGWIPTADTYNNYFKIPGIAHNGHHCVAIEAGNSRKQFARTYIRSQLLCHLRKGNKYRIEFYARSRHAILDSIGIYFTADDFLFDEQVRHKITPSVYAADGNLRPRRNDTSWQKLSISYTATGNELFMTLGNFSKNDITGPTGIPLENNFFIFFDDVSLRPEDPREKICDTWQKTKEELYAFDARHQFLDSYIKRYKKEPPGLPVIDKTVLQTIDTLILPDIFFETDESDLSRKSFHMLDNLCSSLMSKRIDSMVIEGHTDNRGTYEHNEKLSLDRALSVSDYISQKILLKRELFITRGWADKKPVADNQTSEGRSQNRRVELFIYLRQ